MLIDTHCHLDHPKFDEDRVDILQRAKEAGISKLITIGCDAKSSERALNLAKTHQNLFATVGIHPHDAANAEPGDTEKLRSLAQHKKCVAIGECGLDYYYDNSPREIQQEIFRQQIKMAHKEALPLVIHVRDAWDDFFKIMDEEKRPQRGAVVHCFTGTKEHARGCLERDLHLSIPGVLTFKNPGDLPEVVQTMPENRFFVETDAPFLAPTPHRGKRNEPSFVVEVAKRIAELRDISYDAVLEITGQNANTFFRLES